MQTTYSLKVSELNSNFLESVKAMFKNKSKKLTVTISTEEADMDETEFITRNPKNKAMLDAAIKNIAAGKTVAVDIDQYLKR